jgi:curli biogenesis system outer membrane secretion channel CsgG
MARGVSDQRKEQIMRSVTYTLSAALLVALAQFSAASAQTPPVQSPQTKVPQAQSPDQTIPAASIPNQKLDAAAAAMQRVASLKRDYLKLLEDAAPDDQPRIVTEASSALEKAVTDQGLSVEEYTTIVEMAENDVQVRQKIIERMQAPAK